MNELTDTARPLLALLREHPELLDDNANREALRDLVVILRDMLDDANTVAVRVALAELEQERPSEE